jgi:hypothetical protein
MTDLPRWVFAAVLLILVAGLIAYARGTEHHRGENEGALGAALVVQR